MSQFHAEDVNVNPSCDVQSSRDIHQNPGTPQQDIIDKPDSQDLPIRSNNSFSNQIHTEYSEEYVSKNNEFNKKPTEYAVNKSTESFHNRQLSENDRTRNNDIEENYNIPKMEPRHGHPSVPLPFPGQSRMIPGQGMAQTPGPTPTLNQLLQSSSPVHRIHSNYSSTLGPESYQQPWAVQRPTTVSSLYSQPCQRPPQTSSPRLHNQGVTSSPTASSYPGFNQRFSAPIRPHAPYSHHQVNTYNLNSGPSTNLFQEQRTWNQGSNPSIQGPMANSIASTSNSPQRSMSRSPAPPPSSPQPSSQQQELSGQNSNDSSSGPAGPTTPNSQTMRPTPSPTGSTGSRSMSPAVVSTEESPYTPKSRKDLIMFHNHPCPPQSTVASTPAGINTMHEEYSDIHNPNWPRPPASPMYSSHVTQDPYRSKKADSLSKLYEMDDSVERRAWLDKLISFMEERRTPITSCPTISKNPLDLFRLYIYVKERGGFIEVCKVTKNKTWKDIAGLLGIGASSSAAYTLRKHYTKHLLAYECHFDRGGVDPQPIINQVEAGTKKKGSKTTSSIPSPGSSNSQDSYPAGNSNSSLDAFANFQNSYTGNSTAASSTDYNPHSPRPPSQSSASSHHVIQQQPYANPPAFTNYSQDQYIRSQNVAASQQNEFIQPYSSRPHYSSYSTDLERNYNVSSTSTNSSTSQDIFNRYGGNQQHTVRNAYSPGVQPHNSSIPHSVAPPQSTSQIQPTQGGPFTSSQDYYRADQTYNSNLGSSIFANPAGVNKNMPPPALGPQTPRRHPDFVKDQQYPIYTQPRSSYTGWPGGNNQFNSGSSVRMQYPNTQTQLQSNPPHQQVPPTQIVTMSTISPAINSNSQYSWNNQQNIRSLSQSISSLHSPPLWDNRCAPSPSLYTSSNMNQNQFGMGPQNNHQSLTKREVAFPMESVESVTPLSYKRRKLLRSDIPPVEAWRIMMALRSGLLAESCWALDVLNVLLFDDSSVQYFGLSSLPGLLDILLEHFSRSLSDMFENEEDQTNCSNTETDLCKSIIDLGIVSAPDDLDRSMKIISSTNYSLLSRKGKPVKIIPRNDDIFISDSQRLWDHQAYDADAEPWHIDTNSINYIITFFEAQMKNRHSKEYSEYSKQSNVDTKLKLNGSSNNNHEEMHKTTEKPSFQSGSFSKVSEITSEELKNTQENKKKKMKNLNQVLFRITKTPLKPTESSSIKLEDENSIEKNSESQDSEKQVEKTNDSSPDNIGQTPKSETQSNKKDCEEIKNVRDSDVEVSNESSSNKSESQLNLNIRDPAGTLKRKQLNDYEDESYSKDEASLYLVSELQDKIARRCVCLSTILRNLSFIPGNEMEFAKNITFLSMFGKLLLLHHDHPIRIQKTRNYDREEDADFTDSCSSLQIGNEWWWDFLCHIRENFLVIASNIAGYLDLSLYPEEVSRPILDGLLHWSICPAAHGQDPFPTVNNNSTLSPQRLALEALCKLCVTDSNVDLVVATPPFSRLQKLCCVLSRFLCRSEEQVLREFSVNLLYFLSSADSGVTRTIALQTPCIGLLVSFIEQAENTALNVANQHGITALRENPESMGTSLDMLRRAAGTLLNLSKHPDNRPLLFQHETRLLALVMSQILDQQVAAIIARVLFQCSRMT
uniref:ARID domain-containing protein n=1 Tax=Trichogramma kaykai TaxID=54128 RepID=A0ABD2XH75_9HYME